MKDLYGAVVTSSFDDHQNEYGRAFVGADIFTLANVDDVKIFSIKQITNKVCMNVSYTAIGGIAEIEIHEEGGAEGGALFQVHHRNRSVEQSTTVEIREDPTFADGSVLFSDFVTGEKGETCNFILGPALEYAVKVIAKTAGVRVAIKISWIEDD